MPEAQAHEIAPACRAATRRCPETARSLVREPAGAGAGKARLHRRDRGEHEDGTVARPQSARRTLQGERAPWPLEDDDLHGGLAPQWSNGALGPGRADGWRDVPCLGAAIPMPNAPAGRPRDPRQSQQSQSCRGQRIHRCGGRDGALSAALSPDFNPIEQAFAKLKALLRKAAARTVDDLWAAIAAVLKTFTSTECKNYFVNSGYDPE